MALLEPDETYGWHDAQTSWREVKVAVLLVLTIGLTRSCYSDLQKTPATTRHCTPSMDQTKPSFRGWWIWTALALPYVGLLWLPLYNDWRPALLGFPFFYWYQFAWVPLTSLLLYLIYRRVR